MTLNLSITIPDNAPHASALLADALNAVKDAGGTVERNKLVIPPGMKGIIITEVRPEDRKPLAGFTAPEGT